MFEDWGEAIRKLALWAFLSLMTVIIFLAVIAGLIYLFHLIVSR